MIKIPRRPATNHELAQSGCRISAFHGRLLKRATKRKKRAVHISV